MNESWSEFSVNDLFIRKGLFFTSPQVTPLNLLLTTHPHFFFFLIFNFYIYKQAKDLWTTFVKHVKNNFPLKQRFQLFSDPFLKPSYDQRQYVTETTLTFKFGPLSKEQNICKSIQITNQENAQSGHVLSDCD